MGKVFLALDQKTGKEVAVKIVKDQTQWDRENIKNRRNFSNYYLFEWRNLSR